MIFKTFILSLLYVSTYADHNDGSEDVGLFVVIDPEGDVPVIDFSTKSSQCEPLKQYARLELDGTLECEHCGKETFLETYNAVADSTTTSVSGTKHGICCQNSHHKVCKAMIKEYKLRCEYETESTRTDGNFYGSVYGKGVDSGTTCAEHDCTSNGCPSPGGNVADGDECDDDNDCTSGYCKTDKTCGSCSSESACANGVACTADSHCTSQYCNDNDKCGTCTDDNKCEIGDTCQQNNHCTSGYCNTDKCAACKDANSNICAIGAMCDDDNDCTSQYCNDNAQCGTCVDDNKCEIGDTCQQNNHCTSGYCNTGTYKCAPCKDADDNSQLCAIGATCDADGDCSAGTCQNNGSNDVCTQSCTAQSPCDVGGTCTADTQCLTGFCYLVNPNGNAAGHPAGHPATGICAVAVCSLGIDGVMNSGCTPGGNRDRYELVGVCQNADATSADCDDRNVVTSPAGATEVTAKCCRRYSIDDLPCMDDNWYQKDAMNSDNSKDFDEDSEFCGFFPGVCAYNATSSTCDDTTKYDCMDTNTCADGEVCKVDSDCTNNNCTDYKCAPCSKGGCSAGDGCFDGTCAACSGRSGPLYCDGTEGDDQACVSDSNTCTAVQN